MSLLMNLVGRRVLHRLFVLVSGMTADQAAGGGAQKAMMAGIMTGHAADDRALDAALGVRRDCRRGKGQRQGEAGGHGFC